MAGLGMHRGMFTGDRTLNQTGSYNKHNKETCRRNSKSAVIRREGYNSKNRQNLTKSAYPGQRRKQPEEHTRENSRTNTSGENSLKDNGGKIEENELVVEDVNEEKISQTVVTYERTMKETPTAEASDIEQVAAVNADHQPVNKTLMGAKPGGRRIDNGMVVRTRRPGGGASKVLRRGDGGSPSRYHNIRPVTVGGTSVKSVVLSRSPQRDSSKSSNAFRTTLSSRRSPPSCPRRSQTFHRGESVPTPRRSAALSRETTVGSPRRGGEVSPRRTGVFTRGESDDESTATLGTIDTVDFHPVDISADSGWDTDLDAEEEEDMLQGTLKAVYIESCKKAGVIPASYFLRHMEDTQIEMKHHGLGPQGIKPIAISLVSNTKVLKLNLTDNWLGREGGQRICDMLSENCYIAELDLSENRLGIHFAQSFKEVLRHNSSLTHVSLIGNHLDDRAAEHIAEAIMFTGSLTHLDLSRNLFGEQAGVLLGPAISENSSLKHLDLSWNGIRRKGAKAVAEGIKTNVLLQSVNLAWNGFGSDGAKWLGEALKVNSALELLDVTNNRITTEGAVLLGKGISVNESLKVLKIGKNPMQSAGCFALCAALLKNPNSLLQQMDFTDIMVNDDFHEMYKKVKDLLPSLRVRHGGDSLPKKPRARVHPMVKLQNYIEKRNLRMIEFFNQFDKDGSMSVTREEFAQGIEESGIKLTPDEVNMLLDELDKDGDGEINYSELVIGSQDFTEKERKAATAAPLMAQ